MHLNRIVHIGSSSKLCKFLTLLTLMSLTHLTNIAKGNVFVNKFT
jgi:hypothetical protein